MTWRSKKQPVVTRSSVEAELQALAQGIRELLWLKRIMDELSLQNENPMLLYYDNKSAIGIAHNPTHHDRTKHIEVVRHFIEETIEEGLVCIPYIISKGQLADFLTKGLTQVRFEEHLSKLDMINIYVPT